MNWELAWSSEDPKYGGFGTPPFQNKTGWFLPGRSALFLTPSKGKKP
jgi:maltooligosyltrehalose trehalohydrolase